MNRPKHLLPTIQSARPELSCCRPAGNTLAAALLVFSSVALPVSAQNQAVPEFTVPVLEDVDPATVTFDGSIIERDRSQGAASLPGTGNSGNPNASGTGSRSGNGIPGASGGGAAPGGGPSIFSGGPAGGSQSSTSMPGSSSGSGNQGVDVNVSVNGIPADGSISIPSLPGADTGSSGNNGPSSADGGGNNDGGLEVNVDIAGGKQLPTLNIPGMPGMPGMPGSSNGSGMPGMPGSSSGSGMPGLPGSSSGNGGMPGLPGSSSGSGSSGNGRQGTASGNGSPGSGSASGNGRSVAGTSGNGSSPGMGSATGSGSGSASGGGGGGGQRSVLDKRLEKSFGVFDGMIIGERERAQTDANAAGSSVMGTGGGVDGQGDSGEGGQMPGVIIATGPMDNSSGGGMIPGNENSREGEFSHQAQSYPVPEDIPSGNDDDVVARQLREAAMTEPDPELRKKLWDEYRLYTGLPVAE